jgi:hypothetical protein
VLAEDAGGQVTTSQPDLFVGLRVILAEVLEDTASEVTGDTHLADIFR